jgi:hypothetical protein
VDVFVGERSAIRIIPFEYMPSRFHKADVYLPPGAPPPLPSPDGSRFADQVTRDHSGWTHSFRVSVGFVYGPSRRPESAEGGGSRAR